MYLLCYHTGVNNKEIAETLTERDINRLVKSSPILLKTAGFSIC